MKLPLVSIIIPVYNVENYLDKCIKSCLNQSYTNIEIIAVDDGSSDTSGELLDRFALKDKRLKIIHQPNSGVVLSRNKALKEAKGEFLFFVDSDDYIAVNAIEILHNSLADFPGAISIGGISYDQNGKYTLLKNSLPYGESPVGIRKALLAGDLQLSLCSKLIPSELFRKIKIIPDLKIGEDAYAVIQLIDYVEKIVIVKEPLYFYVMRGTSVMNRPDFKAIASQLLFMKLVEEYYSDRSQGDMVNFVSLFMLNQYFQFLRMGGSITDDLALTNRVNNVFLKNSWAISMLPIWRKVMLKFYQYSPFIGNVFRFVFVNLRFIVRR